MTASSREQLKQRRWFARLIVGACLLSITVCCVAAGYHWRERRLAIHREESIFEGTRSVDAWLERRFQASTSREGTVAWSQLLELCDHPSALATTVPIVGDGPMPELGSGDDKSWPDIEVTERYLAEMQPVIALVRQARDAKAPVWIDVQFHGISTSLSELQATRSISRLLYLEALYAVYINDAPRALDAIRSLDALPRAFDWHLYMVGELIHTALRQNFYSAVSQSLQAKLWNEEQLDELQAMVAEPIDIQHRWKESLMAERVLAFDTQLFPSLAVFISPKDRLALLDDYEQAIELGSSPVPEFLSRARQLDRSDDPKRQPRSAGHALLRANFLPSLEGFAKSLADLEVHRGQLDSTLKRVQEASSDEENGAKVSETSANLWKS